MSHRSPLSAVITFISATHRHLLYFKRKQFSMKKRGELVKFSQNGNVAAKRVQENFTSDLSAITGTGRTRKFKI